MSVHKKKEDLCTLETFVDLDIKDSKLKLELLDQIKEDIESLDNDISPKYNKYFENKDLFSNLGQAHLEILKANKTIKNFYGNIYTVIAANKFKKLLRKKSDSSEINI